ncbi:LCP family protein [Thermus scotoductus]|uniref:LytR family transcriptional regulator n=1 Tax=Thermus scotoductus TaxID=37636 RepID=A0A430RFY7_THESC|nr:LCP family protein [Thermus scotoductus]RTG98179.1 LytR family transcriptional regulator [Thermus scotoductus]RTH06738.1 LytR family transcriptional regulator [Thermus scotoductus]RTH20904.1 LytR family transcriptional regulator [Thermus scotoductus]RTI02570.1 LytR family transcriptional regulator [Thermus scotoductus]RTI17507.1 LytR family transcriptional regulator [Thermus scotoductus]
MRRLFLGLFLLFIGALAFWAYPLLGPAVRQGALPSREGLRAPLTLLVYGSSPEYLGYHKRAPERFRGLADTILLVRLDPVANRVVVLSIPRDVWVNLPGYGWYKVNAASPLGGPALMKEAVARITGVQADRYLVVSTEALRRGVDALGGVRVCVEKPMRYRDTAAGLDINLEPGCQVLDGKKAEGYLRFRKDALGDIGRIQRQQAFFHALKEQVLSPSGLLRLPRAVAAVEPYFQTDLTREDRGAILGFATKQPELVSLLLPGRFGGGGWAVDRQALDELLSTYFAGEGVAEAPEVAGKLVALVYGPGQGALAEKARERLHALGLRVILHPVDLRPVRTEVLENGPGVLAKALGEALGVPYRVSGEAVLGADLTLRLGEEAPFL